MRRYLIYFPLLFLTVSCEIIEEDISGRAVTTIAPADDAEVPAGETRLEAGRYEWTVAAFNSGYETSSPALRLTVAEEPVPEEPEKSDNPESAEP